MSVTLTGTYDGTVIRLDNAIDIEANTRFQVTLEAVASPTPGPGFLETAMALSVSGPSDWATNLEQYVHGPLAADE